MSTSPAFDPEIFRALGHAFIDDMSAHLATLQSGEGKVGDGIEPLARAGHWSRAFSEEPSGNFLELAREVMRESVAVGHPRFLGHQQAPALPLGALCDALVSLLNNSGAIYEMGPPFVMMEQSLLGWMTGLFELGPRASGLFTSGGTLGNLTALLAARQRMSGGLAWREGTTGGEAPALLVSSQAHYSIDRAVRIMGWGEGGAVAVPVDAHFRLDPKELEGAKRLAEAKGRRVIAVVASVCTTATGAFDPLGPIADFCEHHGLWLHADGAHGAAAILSPRYRERLRGIERVDSLVWDAHKMMLTAALTTAVLFRDATASCEAFAQDASYLFEKGAEREWFNPCHRTVECTKRDSTFRLYAALRVHGTRLFSDYVTRAFDLAGELANLVREAEDFELGAEPQANIVCYRYRAPGTPAEKLDSLQARLRERMLRRGNFYVVQTRLPRGLFLRSAIMSPFSERSHLRGLLEEVRECAQSLDGH